jgi:uncharacterized protein (DUF2345 family)
MDLLSYIFPGDFNITQSSSTILYGDGKLNVSGNATLYATTASTNSTTGALTVRGGVGILGDANLQADLNVIYATSNLATVNINTNLGPTTITGRYPIQATVGSGITLISTGGSVKLCADSQDVEICAETLINLNTGINGNISLLSGTNGGIDLITGANGISGVTSSGNIELVANNGTGSFTVNSVSNNQNLTLSVTGATDSKVNIESTGITDAITINALNTAGNIKIQTSNTGSGAINLLSGSGGINLTTTNGSVIVTADANINLTADQDIKISSGNSLNLYSGSIFAATSIGNIQILQPPGSTSGIMICAGSSGLELCAQTGGPISITSYAAPMTLVVNSAADAQDLSLILNGTSNSSILLNSYGSGTDAIGLTTSTGGITISSKQALELQSVSTVNIATSTTGVPVNIGTSTSTTTINGNLDVKGMTTTIESTTVTLVDNIFTVNNGPGGISDGGLGIKRYQVANNANGGSVITDTPIATGVSSIGNTFTTVNLGGGASAVNDFYNNWWIRITSGTGATQVRRILDYDGTTKIATIYGNADQTTQVPVEGLDWLTIPDDTSNYALYYHGYQFMIWDESNNEFAFVSNPADPGGTVGIVYYSNVHLNNLIANNVFASTINSVPADTTITFTLTNNSTAPVTISSFPALYGIFRLMIRPTTDTDGAYLTMEIGRSNQITSPGTGARIVQVPGASNEKIFIKWDANALPSAYYRPQPGGGGTTSYTMRISTI